MLTAVRVNQEKFFDLDISKTLQESAYAFRNISGAFCVGL